MLRRIFRCRSIAGDHVLEQLCRRHIRKYHQNAEASYKRLVICCDGTWQQSDAPAKLNLPGYRQRKLVTITDSPWLPESNITRLYKGISSVDVREDGKAIPQVVFYQNGIGTNMLLTVGGYAAGSYPTFHPVVKLYSTVAL